MNESTSYFTSLIDGDLLHVISFFYTSLGLGNFDLHNAGWFLHGVFILVTLAIVPSVKLFHYTKKNAVPLMWKLLIQGNFYLVVFLFFGIVLCTLLGVFYVMLFEQLQRGIPTSTGMMMGTIGAFGIPWSLATGAAALVGSLVITQVYVNGKIEPYLEGLALGLMRKNSSHDKALSDIRMSMGEVKTLDYDMMKFVNPNKGIFVGLDDRKKPVYVPLNVLRESHVAILGETGSGKGIASQMLLTQLNRMGNSLVVFDPKKEEFLYSVFRTYAQGEFLLIDLDAKVPQFNPIEHLDGDRLYPILESAFSLKDKGQEADYYRGIERANLRKALLFYTQGMTFDDWFKVIMENSPDLIKTKEGDLNKLGQYFLDLSLCRSIQGKSTFDLKNLLNHQGTLYVKCQQAKSSSNVKLATKVVLMSLLDEIENRSVAEEQYPVSIMLDELKFILTERVSQALGSIRSKGGSFVLNFQSMGDLTNLDDTTLDGRAIQQQINANTAIKICYKTLDENNNAVLSRLTGTVVKESRSSNVSTNQKMVSISQTSEGYANQQKEAFYTENDFLSLPKRVAILIGVGLAKRIYTTPVKVNKLDFPKPDMSEVTQGFLEKLLFTTEKKLVAPESGASAPVAVQAKGQAANNLSLEDVLNKSKQAGGE